MRPHKMECPIIEIHQGLLRGAYDRNINGKKFVAFKGIPYAKPPIAKLRFRDPESVESWLDVKNATKFGDRCAQLGVMPPRLIGSDDCLYLNVYTRTLDFIKPRAVMVWIHGGGFMWGSGDDDIHGPDYLIEKDIVLVTINYRVGILGFLNVEDEVAPGNQGLKDQVQALKWVQQNIANFGGDPTNVTIFGESAGAASVHYLTISPLAQGLFHKAILQSGAANNPWASVAHEPIKSAEKLAKLLGKDISDPKSFVEYLQTLDVARLIELERQIPTLMEKLLYLNPFIPSVDKNAKNPFLPMPVEEAIKSGIKVPCIIGTVTHEGIILAAAVNDEHIEKININRENLLLPPIVIKHLMEKNLIPNDLNRFYLGDENISKDNLDKVVDLLSVTSFFIGIHDIIEMQAKIKNVPTYVYKLIAHTEDTMVHKRLKTNLKGTCHAEDVGLLFYPKLYEQTNRKIAEPDSTEYVLIQRFTELWTNFAKTGHPTIKITNVTPIIWEPINRSIEYNCLMITEDLNMRIEVNILNQLSEQLKTENEKI